MIPQNKTPEPPTREKLELLLKNDMLDVVERAIKDHGLKLRIVADASSGQYTLKDILSRGERHLEEFITVDERTAQMKKDALLISRTGHEVLIIGETGTGKEIIGKSMIGQRGGEIKAVNCGALPDTLFESELFGHVRGAFTSADFNKEGLCQEAKDGVMFLDEIGDMPLGIQVKLLRAIQEKRVRRVGATKDEEISCRFVCATHRDIPKMVEDGQFRRDLYARISTLELRIAPLRERMCDVIPITKSLKDSERFLEKHSEELKSGQLNIDLNVRSLQQYVTRFNVLGRIKLD